jgi:hypothetical protein
VVNSKYIIIQGGDETQKNIKIGGKMKVHYHSRGDETQKTIKIDGKLKVHYHSRGG